MATTALYRTSSGEVRKVSVKGQPFSEIDPTYWGVLTDPDLPDGTEVRSDTDGLLGALRELGYAKIAIPASNLVRNATQIEIDTFAALETEDIKLQDAAGATSFLETHHRVRRNRLNY